MQFKGFYCGRLPIPNRPCGEGMYNKIKKYAIKNFIQFDDTKQIHQSSDKANLLNSSFDNSQIASVNSWTIPRPLSVVIIIILLKFYNIKMLILYIMFLTNY